MVQLKVKLFAQLTVDRAFFNAGSAFDTLEAGKICFNHRLIPNISENKRNRKQAKCGRKRLFNAAIYRCSENAIESA